MWWRPAKSAERSNPPAGVMTTLYLEKTKPMIPKTFEIPPYTFDVQLLDEIWSDGKQFYGEIKYKDCIIKLDSTTTPQMQRTVLLHEVMHGLDYVYGIKLKEQQIETLSHAIAAIMPQLIEVWSDNN